MSSETEFVVKATVVETVGAGAARKTVAVKCLTSDTVLALQNKLRQLLPVSIYPKRMHIAFRGILLNDGLKTIHYYGLSPLTYDRQHPMIFVTFANFKGDPPTDESSAESHSDKSVDGTVESKQSTAANAAPTGSSTQQPATDASVESEEKMCRLCFGSEEGDIMLGRLFSPCRCSGTMKYIHRGCLNEWRAHAPRERSQFVCDQCGFEYNIARANWAAFVENPRLSYAVSAVVLLLSVLLAGVVATVLQDVICPSKYRLDSYVYYHIEWDPVSHFAHRKCRNAQCEAMCNSWSPLAPECPRWCGCRPLLASVSEWSTRLLTVAFNGVLLISTVGLYVSRDEWWRGRTLFLLTLLQNTRMIRVLLVVGIGHSFWKIFEKVQRVVKLALYKWGEHILEVDTR